LSLSSFKKTSASTEEEAEETDTVGTAITEGEGEEVG